MSGSAMLNIKEKEGSQLSGFHERSEGTQDIQEFELAFENCPDMILIIDAQGVVAYSNVAYQKASGLSGDTIAGKNAAALWYPSTSVAFQQKLWHAIKVKKQAFESDICNKRQSGEEYETHVTVYPIRDRRANAALFVSLERDTTHEKEANRTQAESLPLVAHQLSAPMSVIRWCLEALLAERSPAPTTAQKHLIQQAFRANRRTVKIVDTILYMAHVEGGAIPNIPKYVNLQRLTNEELQAFKTDISRKKLHVTVACPHDLGIYIDEGCCQIIIQNVISNAVKYAARGGSISIAITPDDDTIHFAISDTGCGIPKDQQGDIFKKMFRASNAQVINVDGNGLGLYLVKLLVQHLQGDIRFTSREGHGTTFRVTLPAGATKEDGRSAHTTLI